MPAAPIDARHAVGLTHVEIRIVERGDRPGVVQEGALVLDAGLEAELVDDVVLGVAVVVDVDSIEHVIAELVEVRAASGRLERDPVRDQGDGVRCVRAHEGVGVSVVRQRIGGDERRLAVARCQSQIRRSADQAHPYRPSDIRFMLPLLWPGVAPESLGASSSVNRVLRPERVHGLPAGCSRGGRKGRCGPDARRARRDVRGAGP